VLAVAAGAGLDIVARAANAHSVVLHADPGFTGRKDIIVTDESVIDPLLDDRASSTTLRTDTPIAVYKARRHTGT
jgi:hypothetical protein